MKTILVVLLSALSIAARAAGETNADASGLALQGYDPVAYFTEQKAVRGRPQFSAAHEGVTYYFFNAANRDAFVAAPQKFLPQYGGYCAFGAASGYKAPIEPGAWTIVDGKLYLNYNRSVREKWASDIPGYVDKADRQWPALRSK